MVCISVAFVDHCQPSICSDYRRIQSNKSVWMHHCPSHQRRLWQINLRNDLFKLFQRSNTNPVLANIMIDGLFHWFRQTPQIPQCISPTYDELIISQGQMGWSQLLLGRWSREWATLQTKYLQRTNSIFTSQNHGTFWLSSIFQLICPSWPQPANQDTSPHN
jgi:hypothetical protein